MEPRTHGGQPSRKRHRGGPGEAPRDMKGCAVGCYIWGQRLPIMVDVMVLGNSLLEHGVKAQKVLCINEDTAQNGIANLMRAFWHFVPVKHVPLPRHLKGSEQSRLQGVYSKLQTVKIFSSGTERQQRFLLMDADMLVRANLDDVFAQEVPAGVMRGDTDSCLFEPRPSHTYFYAGNTMKRGDSHPAMKGGINGGLVLFEPDANTYDDMMEKLYSFTPKTKMAEQEFLSYYWGRTAEWHAMHKKYNFQIHQLYFASPEPPPAQDRQSSFAYMVDHPNEIRVFHFSADQKPSQILIDSMASVQGWLKLEDHLEEHARYMMSAHGSRNPALHEHPEWIDKIEKLLRDAHHEWFEAWKRTYVNVVNFVLEAAYKKMVFLQTDDGDYVGCPTCGAEWHTEEIEENPSTIRDHLLFNCAGIGNIRIPVKHQTNLLTLFFVPCGAQVESKLCYLAEVYRHYVGVERPSRTISLPPLPLNPSQQPQILLPHYTIPSFVLATTEDKEVDASTQTGQEPEASCKAMQRRYTRGLTTLGNPKNFFCYREGPQRAADWQKTLETVSEAGQWLIKHEAKITAFTSSKARGSSTSSSSGQPMMTLTPKGSATGGPSAAPAVVTPPWRQQEPPVRPTSARPSTHVPKTWMPPPPPPPRR